MKKNEIAVRRRRRKKRIYRLARCLFPVFAFLFVPTACMTVFLLAERKPVEPPTADASVLYELTQGGPSQTASDLPDESKPEGRPKPADLNSWNLLLVNPWNLLPEDYSIETVTLSNGLKVDKRCYPDLQDMMDACRADGLSPVICSAYRTWEEQEQLYQRQVECWLDKGYSQEDAKKEAGKVVAVPGTSEHQSGLALDIVDVNNQLLDETQESTEVQKWLMEHSWEYGFILRYPKEKGEITGIIYEPWHYRYVGREDAEQIHTLGICLEEYLEGTY